MVLQNIYTKLVSRILNLPVEKGDIAEVPRCQAVLEFRHILQVNDKSSEARTPPSYGFNLDITGRVLVFKYKKQFLSRSRTSRSAEVPASNINIAEALARPTYRKLKAMLMEMKTKNTYERVWTINGHIKYVCKNDINSPAVKDIFD